MSNFEISNDAVAARAQELAKADGVIVWQRYVEKALKQLETEAEANRPTPRTAVFTDAEIVKATMEGDAHLAKRAARCV